MSWIQCRMHWVIATFSAPHHHILHHIENALQYIIDHKSTLPLWYKFIMDHVIMHPIQLCAFLGGLHCGYTDHLRRSRQSVWFYGCYSDKTLIALIATYLFSRTTPKNGGKKKWGARILCCESAECCYIWLDDRNRLFVDALFWIHTSAPSFI